MHRAIGLKDWLRSCLPRLLRGLPKLPARSCTNGTKPNFSEFNRLGLTCFDPEGAFYVFPCIKSTGLTSEEFCERLLYEEKVAAVPGSAFGDSGEGYMRISYAYSLKHLMEAMKRIEKFLKKLEAEKHEN